MSDAYERPAYIALLALEALGRYVASDLAQKGETAHEDLAVRLTRVMDKDEW